MHFTCWGKTWQVYRDAALSQLPRLCPAEAWPKVQARETCQVYDVVFSDDWHAIDAPARP